MPASYKPSSYHRQIFLCVGAGLVPSLVCIFLLYIGGYDRLVWTTILVCLILNALIFSFALSESIKNQWQIVSNILASFREGDFSLRIHPTPGGDPISEAMHEVNLLEDTLKSQRLSFVERQNLLIKILREVDLAIFCVSSSGEVTLANHFAASLYDEKPESIIGKSTRELHLDAAVSAETLSAIDLDFPKRRSRWLVKKGNYWERGEAQRLIILADLGKTLRAEELTAWKRLIRVIAHELNNSMTPLKSMTHTLSKVVSKDPLPEDWRSDVREGLSVIGNRVENLNRFVSDYSQVARMPEPVLKAVDLRRLLTRLALLDTRKEISNVEGPDCKVLVDEVQIEQALINLIKNAIDAVQPTGGDVFIRWKPSPDSVELEIVDEGEGLAGADNLFVPYFTTKPSGTGIGLFLARQIVEAQGGSLILENQTDRSGCVARITLPIVQT